MALATRKTLISVGLESTYGVDAAPSNAVLVSAPEISPLEGSTVERDFVKPFFGGSGMIRVENFAKVTFDVEVAGAGTAGTAPAYGILFKACNFSETLLASAISGTATTGGTNTITLDAGASAIDEFYTGMTIEITGGTGSGQKGEIINYVGSSKLATIATPWTTAPDSTSAFSIGANAMYIPNSDFGTATGNTSVTIYFNVDGVRHVLLGARGKPAIDLSVKTIPKIKFEFTGLLGTISDAPAPAANFTAYQTPVTISTANTTDINLLGYNDAVVDKLTFDIGNNVVYRQLIGAESVFITDRAVKGTVSIEANLVTTKDWWSVAKNASYGRFSVKHGQVSGHIFGITAPNVQLTDPKYSDSDGVRMMEFGTSFTPFGSGGNDEIRICVK